MELYLMGAPPAPPLDEADEFRPASVFDSREGDYVSIEVGCLAEVWPDTLAALDTMC